MLKFENDDRLSALIQGIEQKLASTNVELLQTLPKY